MQFQFQRTVYQIQTTHPAYALQGREGIVCQFANGIITVLLNGKPLEFKRFVHQPKRNPVPSGKALQWKPASDHPWRQYGNHLNGEPIYAPN